MLIYANFTNVEEKFTTLLWTNGLRFCFCFYDTLVVKSAWRGKLHFFNVFFLFFSFLFFWVAQQTECTRNRCFMGTVAYGCTWVANSYFLMCVVPHPVVSNGRGASNSGFVITWRCKLGLRNDLALQTLTYSNMGGTANVPYWCFVSVEQNNCDLFEILGAANCATTSLRGVANCDIGAHCWTNSADDLLLLLMLLLLLLLICVCHCLAYLRVC